MDKLIEECLETIIPKVWNGAIPELAKQELRGGVEAIIPVIKKHLEAERIERLRRQQITPWFDGKTGKMTEECEQCQNQLRKAVAEELFSEFICRMCYSLNPQHATAANGIGCKSCQDKEVWCGKPSGKG